MSLDCPVDCRDLATKLALHKPPQHLGSLFRIHHEQLDLGTWSNAPWT